MKVSTTSTSTATLAVPCACRCSVCGESRLCACATYTPNPQPGKPPVVTIIPAKQLETQARLIGGNQAKENELFICDACAQEKGRVPKKLWTTWIIAWVALIAGFALNRTAGTAMNPIGIILGSAGAWVMLFSALFLITKAGRGLGMTLLLGFLSICGPLGLVILPLLSKDINRNSRIVTALTPVAEEHLKNKQSFVDWANKMGETSSFVGPRTFKPYTGSGMCDVCNQSLTGKQAWVVPNDVFYGSRQYREHLKNTMRMMGMFPTDADVERMRMMDHSPGSAVCQNCIHMFK